MSLCILPFTQGRGFRGVDIIDDNYERIQGRPLMYTYSKVFKYV